MKTIYEERYNKALESAKRELESCGTLDCDAAKQIFRIFPELRERESDDERIRKDCIKYLDWEYQHCSFYEDKMKIEKCVAWLEKQSKQKHKFNIGDIISNGQAVFRVDNITKNCIGQDCYFLVNVEYEKKGIRYHILIDSQGNRSHLGEITWLCEQVDESFEKQGEQKPADKIEPKFKKGDYVANDDSSIVAQIEGVSTNGYYYTFKNIKPSISYSAPNCEFVDKYYHLWAIEDAKDGDVLAFKDGTSGILIYKEYTENFGVLSYCRIVRNSFIDKEESGWGLTLLSPATKEQRDLLFQKMEEAGYTWDAEKKELKEIEQKPFDYENVNIPQKDFAPKAEPKFKVGDWVRAISSGNIFKILSVNDGLYRVLCYDGVEANYPIEVEKDLEYWTINDAKDGDVLISNESHVIFKEIDGLNIKCYCTYHYLGLNPSLYIDTLQNKTAFYPAVKEQRDFLFQKMHEAGYEWDAENKQVRKNSSINF